MAKASLAPVTASGNRPPCLHTKRAPNCSSGPITRCIGRRRNDASPVRNAVRSWLASNPTNNRAPVPALPMSSTSAGSAKPPTPTPSTCQTPSARRSTCAPKARMAWAVARMSSPSSRPVMHVVPTAKPPSINERWEIDLSPATLTLPESGPEAGGAISGEGIIDMRVSD